MDPRISELLHRIRQAEDEIEQEIQRRRAELHSDFENKRIHFEREVIEQQRRFKMGLFKYVFDADIRHLISAPFHLCNVHLLYSSISASACTSFICFRCMAFLVCSMRDYLV